jgi:tripartite-type tricarboxylate transporter receptor subunit TctC
MFARAEKFDLQVVAYKSETTALNDLLGGRIQLMLASGTLAQQLREGRARGLATLGNQRSPAIPELPTMVESGVAPFPAVPWMGLFGPAKMPREIVERLNREFGAAMARADVQAAMEKQAFALTPSTPGELAAFVKEQMESYRRILRAAGVEPD